MIVWIVGLAGAGKTTLARAVWRRWRRTTPAVVLLDGDDVRALMGHDLGHTLEDRRANGWRICRLCQWLDRQGIHAVVAVLSNDPEQQQWNRCHYSRYLEIFVDTPMAILEQRDQKGLYSGFRAGQVHQVVGLDIPFRPPRAHWRWINDGDLAAVEQAADHILELIERGDGEQS